MTKRSRIIAALYILTAVLATAWVVESSAHSPCRVGLEALVCDSARVVRTRDGERWRFVCREKDHE